MEGWLSFLIFAGLFYLMMRFGCGVHMIHGNHKRTHSQPSDLTDKDPVCGKLIGINEGYGKMHNGQLFRFCSHECLDVFESDPQIYLEGDKS